MISGLLIAVAAAATVATGTPGIPAWLSNRPGKAEQPALQLAPRPGGVRPVNAAAEHQCTFWLS